MQLAQRSSCLRGMQFFWPQFFNSLLLHRSVSSTQIPLCVLAMWALQGSNRDGVKEDDHCRSHINTKMWRLSLLPCTAGFPKEVPATKQLLEGRETFQKGARPHGETCCPVSICRWGQAGSQATMIDESHLLSVFLCYEQAAGLVVFQLFLCVDKLVSTDSHTPTRWKRWWRGLGKHTNYLPRAKPHSPPSTAGLQWLFWGRTEKPVEDWCFLCKHPLTGRYWGSVKKTR